MRTLSFMFADLRDYTGFVERHGDAAATRLITDYRALVRAEVQRADGAEIKTEGDSFYVVFEAAGDAVRCGIAILSAAERYSRTRPERPMRVGIGIHSGEPQPHEGQYVGSAVIVAARLAQQSDAGELLVSEVVRALIPRAGAPEMRERTGLVLKGIADAPRAYAVAWAAAPSPSDDLLGRDAEIGEISRLLDAPDLRVLSLVGPGGVGKTRLALAAADRAGDRFADGSLFVDLSSLRDPAQVPFAIAACAGVIDGGGRPIAVSVVEALRYRELLLVLDNFEQLIDAAAFVAGLIQGTERLRILVTSRQPLRIRNERVFAIAPLSNDPAIALFLERARGAGVTIDTGADDIAAVAEICRRLDGLPLAIELAAARARHLAPRALVARLGQALPLLENGPRDAPERQRTLTRAIGWSYELLDPQLREMFRRCAVFAGGFGPEAAAAVSSVSDPTRVLELLTGLADQSLVLVDSDAVDDEPRFRLLETIREYASERLEESGETMAVRQRHAHYFGQLAQQALPHLEQADQSIWLARLDREQANVALALAWSISAGQVEWGLRLAADLWIYWFIRGSLTEGRQRIAALLGSAKAPIDPVTLAAALNAAGTLARYQREYADAEELISKGLSIRRGSGDDKAVADSLNNLAYVTLSRGDHARARALYEESIESYRSRGDEQGIADALSHLAHIALQERQFDLARRQADEALGTWRRLGDMQGVAWALEGVGKIQLEAGDLAGAVATFEEGLGVATSLGHGWAIALHVDGLACAAAAQDRPIRALRLAGAAAAILRRVTTPLDPLHERQRHRWLERARLVLPTSRAEEAYAAGSALGQEEALAEALARDAAEPGRVRDEWSGLSQREREVAGLIAQGLTNRQIAERLFIASGTADRHVANILGKLDMRKRAQVAAWVADRGLLKQA